MSDLIAIPDNPVTVLVDEKAYSEFYRRVRDEIAREAAFSAPDLKTAKGRGEISALAYKVTRTKTAIDAAGKKLNEEARAKINAVDASRRKIREELDALADEVRKPLTDWENAEKDRLAKVEAVFAMIDDISFDRDSSESVRRAMEILMDIALDPAILRDRSDEAEAAYNAQAERLSLALSAAEQSERDRAELARLRAEAAAREQAEREAREAAEAERRRAEEFARAQREAEAREKRIQEEREAAIARAVAEEKRAAEVAIARAEAEKRAVIERQEREERDRLAAIAETKRQEEARAADRKHRAEVMGAAKLAMMTCGAHEETAKKIVLAIVAGEIPNVRMVF